MEACDKDDTHVGDTGSSWRQKTRKHSLRQFFPISDAAHGATKDISSCRSSSMSFSISPPSSATSHSMSSSTPFTSTSSFVLSSSCRYKASPQLPLVSFDHTSDEDNIKSSVYRSCGFEEVACSNRVDDSISRLRNASLSIISTFKNERIPSRRRPLSALALNMVMGKGLRNCLLLAIQSRRHPW